MDTKSAKLYSKHVLDSILYNKTNEFMVKHVIKEDTDILDLCCGTGQTIYWIKKLNKTGKIYGLDNSREMIKIAKMRFPDVTFVLAAASQAAKFVHKKFDVITCNAGFWNFENENLVLKTAAKLLKKEGIFIFNLSDQHFNFGTKCFSPFLQKLKEIANKKSEKIVFQNKVYNLDQIKKFLMDSNFELIKTANLSFEVPLNEILHFNMIPVMTEGLFPNLSFEERLKFVRQAYKEADKTKQHKTKWIYFISKLKP